MLVVGAMAVVENRVLRREITGLWAQPGVDIVRLDGDDAAIMTRSIIPIKPDNIEIGRAHV